MTTTIVRAVIERFIKSSVPEVLVLKGQWGIGKTYVWKRLIQEFGSDAGLPKYSYVSLFGVSSIAELCLAIVANANSLKARDEQKIVQVWNKLKSLGPSLFRARGISVVNQVTVGLETLAQHLISDTLICLDDFERMNDKVAAELLGFVSSLKEEKNCKVILIFNDQKLDAKAETYGKYREKVVDIELLYSPSVDEVADIVFDGKAAWHELVRAPVAKLGINNIRVLRRISDLASLIYEQVKDFHKGVLAQAVHTVVLFAWCHYERDKDVPSTEFLRSFSSFEAAFERSAAKKEGKEKDSQEAKWESLLDDYGFRHVDEFDLAILEVVERGFAEDTALLPQAKVLDGQCKARDLDQSFTKAWELYHNTFANNEQELVARLPDAFKKSVQQIAPLNLNGTVTLLRRLGKDSIADELIDYYIEQHKDDPKRFDLDQYAFSGDITDTAIREKFAEKLKHDHPAPTLEEAVQAISGDSWGGAQERVLDAATEQQLYDLFKQDHGAKLPRIVKACLRLGGVAGHTEFGQRVRAALNRIAAESKLNADRVRRYLK
jgi:hypothetical protein